MTSFKNKIEPLPEYNPDNLTQKVKDQLRKRFSVLYTENKNDNFSCTCGSLAILSRQQYIRVRKFFPKEEATRWDVALNMTVYKNEIKSISDSQLLRICDKLGLRYDAYYVESNTTWLQQMKLLLSIKHEALVTLESTFHPQYRYSHCVVWEPESQRFLDSRTHNEIAEIIQPHIELQYNYNLVHIVECKGITKKI